MVPIIIPTMITEIQTNLQAVFGSTIGGKRMVPLMNRLLGL